MMIMSVSNHSFLNCCFISDLKVHSADNGVATNNDDRGYDTSSLNTDSPLVHKKTITSLDRQLSQSSLSSLDAKQDSKT